MIRIHLIPLAVVAAMAAPLAAQTTPMATPAEAPAADAMPTDAATYMMKAGAGDQFEIQSSQLALQKTQSAKIKQLANMMITDHTKTTATLMKAAQKAGMTPPPPPPLEPAQQQMMSELTGLDGSAFDATWLRQQSMAHGMALELHQNYAANGDTPALKMAAKSAVPIIKKHISMLKDAGAPM